MRKLSRRNCFVKCNAIRSCTIPQTWRITFIRTSKSIEPNINIRHCNWFKNVGNHRNQVMNEKKKKKIPITFTQYLIDSKHFLGTFFFIIFFLFWAFSLLCNFCMDSFLVLLLWFIENIGLKRVLRQQSRFTETIWSFSSISICEVSFIGFTPARLIKSSHYGTGGKWLQLCTFK